MKKNACALIEANQQGACTEKGNMAITRVDILPVIDRLVFFNSFTRDEKRQMVSDDAHFRVYDPGEMLIRQGSADQSLFIILTGTVNITGGAGANLLAVLRAGDIFGEMAFLTDTRRTANVVAREPVIALKLDRLMFEQLSTEIREKFKDKIIEKLVARLDTANKELTRLSDVARNDAVESSTAHGTPERSSFGGSPAGGVVSGRELIRQIISNTTLLPAMPKQMAKVQQAVRHPGTSPIQLAKIVDTDPAMAAGILKVANSAYYGFRGKVSTIRHASALFGTRRLAELIMAMNVGRVLGKALAGYGLKTGNLWRHSIAVASTAGQIASTMGSEALDSAYMAGLLHDMGKMVLDPYIRERRVLFDQYFSTHPEKSVQDAERDILGFDHAVIAALVCKNWNLPRSISFSIRHHHQPASAGDHPLSHILHLADHIAIQAGMGAAGKAGCQPLDEISRSKVPLDPDALETVAERPASMCRP